MDEGRTRRRTTRGAHQEGRIPAPGAYLQAHQGAPGRRTRTSTTTRAPLGAHHQAHQDAYRRTRGAKLRFVMSSSCRRHVRLPRFGHDEEKNRTPRPSEWVFRHVRHVRLVLPFF